MMVERKQVTYQITLEDFNKLKDELIKWSIEPELVDAKDKSEYIISLQSANNVYDVILFVSDLMSEEERLFMFGLYRQVKTFADIQFFTFGKVIWNWR